MSELTNDEVICLSIMHGGDGHPPTNMLAIGRWEKPLHALAARGFARQIDQHNHVITPQGSTASEAYDSNQSGEYAHIYNEIVATCTDAKNLLEDAANALAEACKKQQRLTGEVPNQIAFTMGQGIIKRALEILK